MTFTNTSSVIGDIRFGGGADTLHVNGVSGGSAAVAGDIAFGGTLSTGAATMTR